jgi:predicted TIM-barrel fold metal-dependent hydrolase
MRISKTHFYIKKSPCIMESIRTYQKQATMARHRCRTIYTGVLLLLLLIFLVSSLRTTKPQYVFDTHEHIQGLAQAELLLAADDTTSIRKSFLLPSPIETLTLNGSKSFTGYKENTDEIFKIAEKYPDRFVPLCTVSPLDPNAAEYFQECVKRGGKVLKLYNGHSYYYDVFKQPLNSPRMNPIYTYAENNKIPILYHINVTNYGDQLEKVLEAHPKLVISVPHFMVSSVRLEKVTELLDKYPNLYTDISFGSPEFMAAGFRRISQDPGKFAKFFNDYKDRILFGTDMVLTDQPDKNQSYMEEIITCYKDLLEKRRFSCGAVSSFYEQALLDVKHSYEKCSPQKGDYCNSLKKKEEVFQQRFDDVTSLNGLGLSDSILSKVYWENAERFLEAN